MKISQIILIIIIVLIIGGILFWVISKSSKNYLEKQENIPQESVTPTSTSELTGKVFVFSAVVLSTNASEKFLIVQQEGTMSEIKIILSDETDIKKLGVPSNAPKSGMFIPTEKEINISDLKAGDKVSIRAQDNFVGKAEISDIEYIEVLP
jgi:hypothetical protein